MGKDVLLFIANQTLCFILLMFCAQGNISCITHTCLLALHQLIIYTEAILCCKYLVCCKWAGVSVG